MVNFETKQKKKVLVIILTIALLSGALPGTAVSTAASSGNHTDAYTEKVSEADDGHIKECSDSNTIVLDDKDSGIKISCRAAGESPITGEAASLKEKVERDTDVISRRSVEDADENTRFIYNGAVTAEVEIGENVFSADDISVNVKRDGIELTQEEKDMYVSAWEIDRENEKRSCEVTLAGDGDYEIAVICTDEHENDIDDSTDEFLQKSGNKSYTSNLITVDTVKPVINVSYSGGSARNTSYYDEDRTAMIKITDRNFRPDEIAVDISAVDVQEQKIPFDASKLTSWSDWTQDGEDENTWIAAIPFHVDAAYTFDISYVDLAGNYADEYEEDSFVVDKSAPDSGKMVISYTDEVKSWKDLLHYFFYRDFVTVTLISEDDISGIDYLTWTYQQESGTGTGENVTERTQTIERKDITFSNKGKQAAASFTLTATTAEQFRGNLSFTATDMAGNTSDVKRDEDRIDIVDNISPTRVVSYSPAKQVVDASTLLKKSSYTYEEESTDSILYYDDDVTAIFKITEENFYPEDVVIKVNDVRQEPTDWNQEGNVWTGTITLSGDGDYRVTMDYADRSANTMKSYTSEKIVIDTVNSYVSVAYNVPVRENDGITYYDGDVNATVVISEENFYAEDVSVTASKDGGMPFPISVNWEDSSSDVHKGTFCLNEDGDYFVTVNGRDLSMNRMEEYTSGQITVDTEKPTVSVSNIRANSANKDKKYGFTITAGDTADNLDAETFEPVLIAVTRNRSGAYEVKEVRLGDILTVESGRIYSVSVANLLEDAVYTLSCKVKDMAGNESTVMLLEDGNEYGSVSFSVNRNGSTFIADENTEFLAEQHYVYNVQNNVVISEINVDPVENYTVKLNGTELKEGRDYTTFVSGGNEEWSKRTYDVKKSLFEEEGDYDIVIESVDKAGTAAYSDIKNLRISCVVDQTAPIVTISGLEENGRYRTKEQTVTAMPTDDGGKLRSFKAVVLNGNGEPLKNKEGEDISTRIELSGEEFERYLDKHAGKVTFTVPEGQENQVRITCDDYALYPDGVSTNKYDEIFSGITISSMKSAVINADEEKPDQTNCWMIAAAAGIAIALLVLGKRRHIRQVFKKSIEN